MADHKADHDPKTFRCRACGRRTVTVTRYVAAPGTERYTPRTHAQHAAGSAR